MAAPPTLKLLLDGVDEADVETELCEWPEGVEIDFGVRVVPEREVDDLVVATRWLLILDHLDGLPVLVAGQDVQLTGKNS